MWHARTPTRTGEETARLCVRDIRDLELKDAVKRSRSQFVANSSAYRTRLESDTLHAIDVNLEFPLPEIDESKIKWLYTERLVRGSSRGRVVYDELVSSAPHGLCVYCKYGQATTLDHFIPKSVVPSLAIEPWNLVPCCSRCNHKMSDRWSATPGEDMLHPYALPDLGRWLFATVEQTDPVALTFYADPPPNVAPIVRQRVIEEFEALELRILFAVACSGELSGLDARLPERFASPSEVGDFLSESAAVAFSDDINDRRGVMYEALAADRWYCSSVIRLEPVKCSG